MDGGTRPRDGTAANWLREGMRLDAADRHEDALAAYDRVVALDPDCAVAWRRLGMALLRLGRTTVALDRMNRALAASPGNMDARMAGGRALQRLGRYTDALAVYDEALRLDPSYAPAAEARDRLRAATQRTAADQRLRLRNGRWLGYVDFGDPEGKPIVCCHGLPGSRLDFHDFGDDTLRRLGVRLIVPDRPGYGISDFQPNRKLMDWPGDVAQLADTLGLGRFAVLGVSGGGPYAATCAYALPERVSRLALVSGAAPADVPGLMRGAAGGNRGATFLASWVPWPLYRRVCDTLAANARATPDGLLMTAARRCGWRERDLVVVREMIRARGLTPNYREQLTEPFRAGGDGYGWDMRLLARPWGFSVTDIAVLTTVWYGERDRLTPPAMGRYFATKIPNCRAHAFRSAGHDGMARQWRDILAALASEPARSRRSFVGSVYGPLSAA